MRRARRVFPNQRAFNVGGVRTPRGIVGQQGGRLQLVKGPTYESITDSDSWEAFPDSGVSAMISVTNGVYTVFDIPVAARQPIIRTETQQTEIQVQCTAINNPAQTQAPQPLAVRVTDANNYAALHWHSGGIRAGEMLGGNWTTIVDIPATGVEDRADIVLPYTVGIQILGDWCAIFVNGELSGSWTLNAALTGGRFGLIERQTTSPLPLDLFRDWEYRRVVYVTVPSPGEEVWEIEGPGKGKVTFNCWVNPYPAPQIKGRLNSGRWVYSGVDNGDIGQPLVFDDLDATGAETYTLEVATDEPNIAIIAEDETYTAPDHTETVSMPSTPSWEKTAAGRGRLTMTVNENPAGVNIEGRLDGSDWRGPDTTTPGNLKWVYSNLIARGGENYLFEAQVDQFGYTGTESNNVASEDFRDTASITGISWDWSDAGDGTANLQLSCLVSPSSIGYQAQLNSGGWRAPDSSVGSTRTWNYSNLPSNTEFTGEFRVDPVHLDHIGSATDSDRSPDYGYEPLILTPIAEATWRGTKPGIATATVSCSIDTTLAVNVEAMVEGGEWVSSNKGFGTVREFDLPNLSATGSEVHNVTFRVNDPDYTSNQPDQDYAAPDLTIMQVVLYNEPNEWRYVGDGVGDLTARVRSSFTLSDTMRIDIRRNSGSWTRMDQWSGEYRTYTFPGIAATGGTNLLEYRVNQTNFSAEEIQEIDPAPDYRTHTDGVFHPPSTWVVRSHGSNSLAGTLLTEDTFPPTQERRVCRFHCNVAPGNEQRIDLDLTIAAGDWTCTHEFVWFVRFDEDNHYFRYDPEPVKVSDPTDSSKDPWFRLEEGGYKHAGDTPDTPEHYIEFALVFGSHVPDSQVTFTYDMEIN